jgi:hypothetical protein
MRKLVVLALALALSCGFAKDFYTVIFHHDQSSGIFFTRLYAPTTDYVGRADTPFKAATEVASEIGVTLNPDFYGSFSPLNQFVNQVMKKYRLEVIHVIQANEGASITFYLQTIR